MDTSAEITCQVKEVKDGDSWQFNKSVIDCNRHMFETGLAADVTFLVSSNNDGKWNGDVCRFRAHKYMLISRSPVFYSMFCGEMAETGEVTVTDVEPNAFKQMLSYIYTDELDLKPDLVMFILYASKKYLLPGLTTKCTDYLKDELDANNASIILDQSIIFDEKLLQDKCLKLIKYKTKMALESESLIGVRQSTLSKILDSDLLTIQEVDVFEACLKWARNKCDENKIEATGLNMREVLGDCVNKFRFTHIEIGDFAGVVALSNILTKDEEVDLFRYIANKDKFTIPSTFVGENRYFTLPFEIITDESTMEQTIGSKTFKVDIDSDINIEIKGLIIGKFISKTCNYAGAERTVTLSLSNVKLNNKNVSGSVNWSNDKLQKWNFSDDDVIDIKAGRFSLEMKFAAPHYHIHPAAQASVYVVPKKTISLKDKHIEIKLSTNEQYIPILGLVYNFEFL